MLKVFNVYRKLEKHILQVLIALFLLHLINAAFFLLANFYMDKHGYEDYLIADFVSYRFLAIFFFAAPLGLLIKGRRLKPFFYAGTCIAPTAALLIIYAIENHIEPLIYISMCAWGIGFVLVQAGVLPYIVLNAQQDTHSEAIAISFQSFSASIFICGVLSYGFKLIAPNLYDEKLLLLFFSAIGFVGIYFISKIKFRENISEKQPLALFYKQYDWKLILKAIIPNFIIAIGAGFTIQFMSLFFLHVHGLDSSAFSLLGATSYFLVAYGILFIPGIKRAYGYEVAITLTQSVSIIVLLLLATTEYYSDESFAIYIAIVLYIFRQPLMNVAGPMTSELTLYYVGKKNQELIGALNASIWSGSWYFSGQMFRVLRLGEMRYVNIFYITIVLYVIAVVLYYFLIKDYKKRKELGLTDY